MSELRGCYFWVLFKSAAIICLAGLTCCILFAASYSNYHASMWALSAAVFAAAAFHLHVMNFFGHIAVWHDTQSLTQIKYLSIGVCALSLVGGCVYIALALRLKQVIDFGENNFYLSSVAAGLSLMSGLLLHETSRTYSRHISDSYPPIIQDQEPHTSYGYA